MVVTGFTAEGDVIVNDPAAPGDADVRRVYPRAAFENVWLTRAPAAAASCTSSTRPSMSLPPSDGNW